MERCVRSAKPERRPASRYWLAGLAMAVAFFCAPAGWAAKTLTIAGAGPLSVSPSTCGQPGPGNLTCSTTYGNVNGLGVGTATANLSNNQPTSAIYYAPFTITAGGLGGGGVAVTAQVTTNFSHTALFDAKYCVGAGCTNFATLPVAPAAAAALGTITNGNSVTLMLALEVKNVNGTAFTGSDSVTVTITGNSGAPIATLTASLTDQNAVALVLSTNSSPSGATVSGSGGAYALNLGNVNGLGVGSPSVSGVTMTTTSIGTPSHVVSATYSTPYTITPSFCHFGTTTATISMAVTSPFSRNNLTIEDSSNGTSFSALPASFTSSTTGAAVSRYVGVKVAHANGAGNTAGSGLTAIITYTLTAGP